MLLGGDTYILDVFANMNSRYMFVFLLEEKNGIETVSNMHYLLGNIRWKFTLLFTDWGPEFRNARMSIDLTKHNMKQYSLNS